MIIQRKGKVCLLITALSTVEKQTRSSLYGGPAGNAFPSGLPDRKYADFWLFCPKSLGQFWSFCSECSKRRTLRDMNEVLRQSRNGSSRRRVSTAVMTGKDHTISIDLFLVMVLYRV